MSEVAPPQALVRPNLPARSTLPKPWTEAVTVSLRLTFLKLLIVMGSMFNVLPESVFVTAKANTRINSIDSHKSFWHEAIQAIERENKALTLLSLERQRVHALEAENRQLKTEVGTWRTLHEQSQKEADKSEVEDCVVCWGAEATFAIRKCGHLCLCQGERPGMKRCSRSLCERVEGQEVSLL